MLSRAITRSLRVLNHKAHEFFGIKRMTTNKKVISIIGTTGVGKSQLSIELAEKFNGEIINADSMQMYKGLENITNKHPLGERHGIPHHVMNHVDWKDQYYIHIFKAECEKAMHDCWNRGKIPILVGGTHYYLQSVLFDNKTIGRNDDVKDAKEKNSELDTSKLTEEQVRILQSEDPELVFNTLKMVDPVISTKFHPNDIRRMKRALEVCYVHGEQASLVYKRQRKDTEERGTCLKYDTLFFWVYSKMPVLDTRLDQRVDKMMQNGGLKELTELYQFYREEKARGSPSVEKMDSGVWQVIGFKEFLGYLEKYGVSKLDEIDNISNPSERLKSIDLLLSSDIEFQKCCEEMKLKTRRYARKQVKWIKNLLGPELQEEEDNGFVKFGKIFVLDATDLSKWNEEVGKQGELITSEFFSKGYVKEVGKLRQIPDNLKDDNLLNTTKKISLNKTDNWVHYQCDVCTDKVTGKPLVYVGEQWAIHLKSKKHKFSLNRGKSKKAYDEWLKNNPDKQNKKVEEGSKSI